MDLKDFTCSDCAVKTCSKRNGPYPKGCRTAEMDPGFLDETMKLYREDEMNYKISRASAQIEAHYYCKLTRVEETIRLMKKIGARRVGIATCVGTLAEARTFAKILRINGFEPRGVVCKVGSVDKTFLDLPESDKIQPGSHESMCNPILQAKILNEEKTDFNVVIGLCVGHDSLFFKYAEAPSSVLLAKDRVTGHCPAQPLYMTEGYYKKLLIPQEEENV